MKLFSFQWNPDQRKVAKMAVFLVRVAKETGRMMRGQEMDCNRQKRGRMMDPSCLQLVIIAACDTVILNTVCS